MTTAVAAPKAHRWNCTREEYHADSANSVSNSEIGDLLENPALYHGRHITRTIPRKEAAVFGFGTVVHSAVLEPDAPKPYAVIPASALNGDGHRKGAGWKAFEAANAGKILLKPEEYAPVRLMIESIRQHPRANALLFESEGENELAIRWECERSGLTRRSLLDRLLSNVIVDLKTVDDASALGFAKSVHQYQYHRQVAFYKDSVHALTGEWLPFVFVAIEKEPPYRCECYELDQEFEELGYDKLNRGLTRLVECRRTGNWNTPTHGTIVTIGAPRWSKYDDEYSFAG